MDGFHKQIITAVNRLFAEAIGAVFNDGADACGGENTAETEETETVAVTVEAEHFGKGTLRNELHFESAVNHGLGRNLGIEADMGCDELFNLLVVNELCNAVVILTHGAAGH